MVRMTKEIRASEVQALYSTLLIQGILSSALADSGSSVSLVSWRSFELPGVSAKIEECKKSNYS